jgi:Protein of unknown function (DUF3105)
VAKKKSRTPPPPRKVQSPKHRPHERTPADRKRLIVLLGVAAAGFVGLGGALLLLAFGGSSDARGALEAAGCTLETVPVRFPDGDRSNTHFDVLPEGWEYPSDPPGGGPHFPTPAPFDVYTEPVEPYRLVHNLEHGAVVIWYGRDVPQAEVDRIVEWYRESPNGIVIASLPRLGNTIGLSAWNADVSATGEVSNDRSFVAKCRRFDAEAFSAFKDAYAFKAPERFPSDALEPGE